MVSIIIVNYKTEKEIINCISSIFESKPKVKFEVIIIDNDVESCLGAKLKNKYSQVRYIKSLKNLGFGAGNNLGVKVAFGDYLFFLNPDTFVREGSIDTLYNFIKNNPKSGMVAPLLYDPSGNIYPKQGSAEYNLISAIVTSSFVNKVFPNNIISNKFFQRDWSKREIKESDVVPGTAFMIKKDLFNKIGMFDEAFFLYFEEYDLAKRIKKLGYKNYIIPKSKILHIWEASTKNRQDISYIFAKSRYIFFKKHYGIFFALIVNIVSGINKYKLMLGLILLVSLFLNTYKINEFMTFIGDQGWFYLSARDMLVNGQFPLVGIASSHPWLHQGPFWTYLLTLPLWIFNFNPVSGAYLTAILGLLSIIGIYIVGSTLFSKKIGIIASLLYSTSPLVVFYMRFPYHTSPIPLFVVALIIPLYKIIQGKINYFPLVAFLLSILYNFEIATVILWGVPICIFFYKLFKDKKIFKRPFHKNILTLSLIGVTVPLLPIILYDVRNGFPQTVKFVAWGFYRMISLFGYNPQQVFSINKIYSMFNFLFDNFIKLIFPLSFFVSMIGAMILIFWVIYTLLNKNVRSSSFVLVCLLFFIPLFLIILNQTPSDAYLPMLFPVIILLFSVFLDFLIKIKKIFILIIVFLVIFNINYMLTNNFGFDKNSRLFTLDKRIFASKQILNIAANKDYNLRGKGPGSEFESFTMNYEYLTWWLGRGPKKSDESLKIYISETVNGIIIEKND